MPQTRLPWKAIVVMLSLAMIWGANMAAIKIGSREMAPLFMAGVRSLVAAACLYIWIRVKGITLFPSRIFILHGLAIGLLFSAQFALIYIGLQYTLASRVYVLIHTAPFFAFIGAHFFLADDQINIRKVTGLLLAFCGVIALFINDLSPLNHGPGFGDALALASGAVWGALSVYIKKYLAGHIDPLQTLFYQFFFSAPVLLIMSVITEAPLVSGLTWAGTLSMFYQCIIVAFLSYLAWTALLHHYPVSLVHSFSFFTPLFGVFLSGAIILGEDISSRLLAALVMVSLGIIIINRQPEAEPAAEVES